jgi:hypothetical protein
LKYGEKRIREEEVYRTFRHFFDRLEKTEERCHDDLHRSIFKCENAFGPFEFAISKSAI